MDANLENPTTALRLIRKRLNKLAKVSRRHLTVLRRARVQAGKTHGALRDVALAGRIRFDAV